MNEICIILYLKIKYLLRFKYPSRQMFNMILINPSVISGSDWTSFQSIFKQSDRHNSATTSKHTTYIFIIFIQFRISIVNLWCIRNKCVLPWQINTYFFTLTHPARTHTRTHALVVGRTDLLEHTEKQPQCPHHAGLVGTRPKSLQVCAAASSSRGNQRTLSSHTSQFWRAQFVCHHIQNSFKED